MSYTNFIKAMESASKCKFYTTAGGKTEEEIKISEKLLGVHFSTQCKEFYEKTAKNGGSDFVFNGIRSVIFAAYTLTIR